MQSLREGLLAAGVPKAHILSERFGLASHAGESGHLVTLADAHGARCLQTAGEPTLLATLEVNKVVLPADCRAGHCLQCRATLVEGQVRWLASSPFPSDSPFILPCVCAVQGPLPIRLAPFSEG
jgi:ferredoxin